MTGEYVFDIREFGMKPPSMLMVRVYPEISVRVELHGVTRRVRSTRTDVGTSRRVCRLARVLQRSCCAVTGPELPAGRARAVRTRCRWTLVESN